jgi:dephospho-CoA kinase
MIIGITGAICSGKRAFAAYLSEKYDFEIVDLL